MPTFTFFGGKGGVGKTTCAAASAVVRAKAGRRVILVSTDPAHSLGDALRMPIGFRPTRVRLGATATIPAPRGTLDAVHLDADGALDRWLRGNRRVLVSIGERGTYLDRADVERLMDLSFPGVSELLALRELVRLSSAHQYDDAIVDTAPTGHTLRLLATPDSLGRLALVLDDLQAKHRAIVEAIARRYRDDEADRFVGALAEEAATLSALLRDRDRVRFAWVTIPEALAMAETRDALTALRDVGVAVDTLVLNRITSSDGACASCRARIRAESAAARSIDTHFGRSLTIRRLPLLDREPVGVSALSALGAMLDGSEATGPTRRRPRPASAIVTPRSRRRAGAPTLRALLQDPPRTIFSLGKGGVGKTTCAAALAIAIAKRYSSRRVLLLSIDPAHSVGDVLDQPVGNRTRHVRFAAALSARELDARAEFARARGAYRDSVDALFDRMRGESSFDVAHDRQIAQDLIELAPPGLDELLALITLIDLASPTEPDGAFDHIVIDTAPTGHAMRLFEMRRHAHAWVRTLMSVMLEYGGTLRPGGLAEQLVGFARGLRKLDALLCSARDTAIIVVTRAAALPRSETVRLVAFLHELGLPPPRFIVVNAATGRQRASCDACRTREAVERVEVRRLRDALGRCAIILAPEVTPPPRGVRVLGRWIDRWRRA